MLKRFYLLSLLVWGIFLTFPFLIPLQTASADDGTSTSCEFQPMAADRSPTMNNIRLDTEGGSNKTWDNTFKGLHRWTYGQWPGVDYLTNTTVAFKNGGVVSLIEWDDQGGGSSIYIDGVGPCKGWRQFFGHLNYNAADRFHVGQVISGDTIVGEPGCSGFENSCSTNGGGIPPHNHNTLGFWSNIFSFDDGTIAASAGGYWWIHPSRVEGTSTTPPSKEEESVQPAPEENQEQPTQSENIPQDKQTEATGFIVDNSTQKTFAPYLQSSILEKIVIAFSPIRNIVIIVLAILAILWIGGMIYSAPFRRSMYGFATVAVIVVVAFVGIRQVSAHSNVLNPPRNTGFVVESSSGGFVVEVKSPTPKAEESTNQPEETHQEDSEGCSIPSKYPESIQQWCSLIDRWAADRNMDPKMIAAVMLQESGGDPEILSASGAVGLMQVMPRDGIAATFVNDRGVPYFSNRPSIAELKNPDFNIEYGSGMLSNLGINEDPREALLHYGPDPDYLQRVYGSRYYYADLVLSIYQNYR